MLKVINAFSSFSVDDIDKAKHFYKEVAGLNTSEDKMGLMLQLPDKNMVYLYQKDNHQPASFTVLNFVVDDIDEAATSLADSGVALERYDNIGQDEKGIARGRSNQTGPDMAWFKDPAGNILSILKE
jgi:catechol-2,3-dioxygenase